jgi:hypothetical protein
MAKLVGRGTGLWRTQARPTIATAMPRAASSPLHLDRGGRRNSPRSFRLRRARDWHYGQVCDATAGSVGKPGNRYHCTPMVDYMHQAEDDDIGERIESRQLPGLRHQEILEVPRLPDYRRESLHLDSARHVGKRHRRIGPMPGRPGFPVCLDVTRDTRVRASMSPSRKGRSCRRSWRAVTVEAETRPAPWRACRRACRRRTT